ncbi:ATP-grasp peptide maturase system methyltransferase [Streptomyces sp. NBC_00091]|uniref:ATP-grasp peptide maturase system methyltransferase n=1 Tax=Streptomyces sp. NBC_00091 TaxID=2975648 RepID=UPI0022597389|nr:ATP-grasp peptide maturase system methyltransferase [Streptomyces sp. NBC_00091]MCX5375913.1 ATP-grasp peptide maturase system methyltransferase [Streptomyces sp. NBC_00091]
MIDTSPERQALADRLEAAGSIRTPAWRKAVEAVPRELFLNPGVFLPAGNGLWRPVTAAGTDPAEWTEIAYSDESLVTQLDNHLTADQAPGPVQGIPTSSSTDPGLVLEMIEELEVEDGHQVLEIGTGTGYSSALMCHRLGEDNITTIEVDPGVAARADAALETAGFSTWTVTGDGLLGLPRRAPYDRVVATCGVRRIPYTWVRQTRPGGIILATIGSLTTGTGLAKVTVNEDGTAEGRFVSHASFMQARSQAVTPIAGDLSSRVAYADSRRRALVAPTDLDEPMPAFLAQLAAPAAQVVRVRASDGRARVYLFDPNRESFAELVQDGDAWDVRQGGPVRLWDDIERALLGWADIGRPGITEVRLRMTERGHTYCLANSSELRWQHPVC